MSEAVKESALVLGLDADACIGDFEANDATRVILLLEECSHDYLPLFRELGCVAREVHQYLHQARRIAGHDSRDIWLDQG